MNLNYEDILSRISEEPSWYDENGTPRYGKFNPRKCPSIYANYVGLFLIACQHCGHQFHVQMHASVFDTRLMRLPSKWHYGDPPIHDCVGDTMNCEDLEVLEFWMRNNVGPWKRGKRFEGKIDNKLTK